MSWTALTPTIETTIAPATKLLVGSLTTAGPVTVRRTFGLVNWRSDQVAADESPMGAFGMCVVSEDAFAAGAASIPGPFSDASSELWLVHQFLFAPVEFTSAAGFESAAGRQYVINSKAMRKFTEEERLVFMIENGHPTQAALQYFMLRVLTSPANC